ncbi:rod shape-determining protein MreC [bacterium]|nr:rod shape-determining protein MreC [bacterium]
MIKINFRKITLFLLICIVLIILHYFSWLSPVENRIVSWVSFPVNKVYSKVVSWKREYRDISSTQVSLDDLKNIKKEKNSLIAENAKLESYRFENKKLRKYLNFLEEVEYKYVMAGVISKGYSINSNEEISTILINRGEKQGIRKGLLVVNSEGVVVGKIEETNNLTSKVSLLTHSNCQLAATIQDGQETYGIVEGDLGLTIKMGFIPQDKEINQGDLVVTSGLEENIPRGYVLGEVVLVERSFNQMWQDAIIEPLVDLKNLTLVSVLVP